MVKQNELLTRAIVSRELKNQKMFKILGLDIQESDHYPLLGTLLRILDRDNDILKFIWNVLMCSAARGGHRHWVEFFIEKGANLWDFAILAAAEMGHYDLVVLLISKGPHATRSLTPRTCDVDCDVDCGVDCDVDCGGGYATSAVGYVWEHCSYRTWECGIKVSARGGCQKLVELFISLADDWKPSASAPIERWEGGMCGAIQGGHWDLVNFFSSKAHPTPVFNDPSLCNVDLWNYFMEMAARGGHFDMVKYVSEGATEWTRGMIAAAGTSSPNGKSLRRDLVDFFISKGAKDWDGGLLAASRAGNEDLAIFFISKGAKIEEGIQCAVRCDYRDLAATLISKVDYVDARRDELWNNCIMAAVSGGHLDLVEYFIFKLTKAKFSKKSRKLAIMIAENEGYQEIIDFLTRI